jgi:D-threo-aldose 1-dehydrogenase
MPISLSTTGIQTTRLGYGCANLMGRLSKRESRRILDAAFDSGIRHFDTAPLYGYGESEGLLGEFIKGRREHVTIATKFGIRPPKRSVALATAKSAARAVVAVFPALRKQIRRRAEQLTQSGCFTVTECTRSLHNSLRELRTDYIDMFLMHEIALNQITPELIAALEDAKSKRLIRAYGTATTPQDTISIRAQGLPSGEIAQFPSGIFENSIEWLPNRNTTGIITHSSLGTSFKALTAELASNSELRKTWSRDLGFDCSDLRSLGALLLQAAMAENSNGIVLFSSVNEHNIRRNAALMNDQTFSDRQLRSAKWLALNSLGPTAVGVEMAS